MPVMGQFLVQDVSIKSYFVAEPGEKPIEFDRVGFKLGGDEGEEAA